MWFYNSELFENIDPDDNILEYIPQKSRKPDISLNSKSDVVSLFETMRYWNVYSIPITLYEYANNQGNNFDKNDYVDYENEYGNLINVLQEIKEHNYERSLTIFHLDETFKFIIDSGLMKESTFFCRHVARIGKLELLKYAIDNDYPYDMVTFNLVVCRGDLKSLEYLYSIDSSDPEENKKLCSLAAMHGHLNCLKFLYENYIKEYDLEWDENVCILAAQNGHLDCLKYAHQNGCDLTNSFSVVSSPAMFGHLDCLKYLIQNGCEIHGANLSARNGNLECLKYLHSVGDLIAEDTFDTAAENGHLECLKFLNDVQCPYYSTLIYKAALNGHYECTVYIHGIIDNLGVGLPKNFPKKEKNRFYDCMVFLHENGVTLTKELFIAAISYKNMKLIKYLQENKCPTPNNVIDLCIKHNSVDLLIYFMTIGYEIYDDTMDCAIESGNLEIVKLIYESGIGLETRLYEIAVKNSRFEIFKFLYERCCPWDLNVVSLVVRMQKMDYLAYMVENFCPFNVFISEESVPNVEILKYLHDNGCPWDEKTTTEAAIGNYKESFKFAVRNGCQFDKNKCLDIFKDHQDMINFINSV